MQLAGRVRPRARAAGPRSSANALLLPLPLTSSAELLVAARENDRSTLAYRAATCCGRCCCGRWFSQPCRGLRHSSIRHSSIRNNSIRISST